jgi:hypothetical protein
MLSLAQPSSKEYDSDYSDDDDDDDNEMDELSVDQMIFYYFSANVNINYRRPIKVYYHICTLRHIRIEINHGSQNVF